MNFATPCWVCGEPTKYFVRGDHHPQPSHPECRERYFAQRERIESACIAMARVMTYEYMTLSAKAYCAVIKDTDYSLLRVAKDTIEHGLFRLEFP